MNKRKLRGVKRSINRWCRRHGLYLDIDYLLSKFGLARAKKIEELESIIVELESMNEQLERACALIDEDALYE